MFSQTKLDAWSAGIRATLAPPLRLELWNGQRIDLSANAPRVTVRVPAAAALACLLRPSLDRLGRAYVEGAIEVLGGARDIIAVGNALASHHVDGRLARFARAFGHSRVQDAQAVRHHYDVSNEFYAQWLDPAMVYSCAYFERGDEDLASAQRKKLDHILRKIRLQPGQRLLDIGCGWGALVLHAAKHYGARCVGITLSEPQAQLARERAARAGLGRQIDIRVEDYRDVKGSFDRITSIGMVEHVGRRQLPAYFARLHALLAPDGVALNHGITSSAPNDGAAPLGAADFIARYVFPRGELAHLSTLLRALQEGGLEALDVENLRRHYARTCAAWSDNFEARAAHIAPLTDARRFRIWRVYLAGASHAFVEDWISLYQIVCCKAGRAPEALPWSRRYMYEPPLA